MDRIEQKICEIIERNKDEIMAFGRDIFCHAELGFKEVRTSGKFVEQMENLGLSCQTGLAVTGVKTYLKDKDSAEGPTLAVIGELDALPIPNHPDAWAETGASHCCGHNAQLAAVIGAAMALTDPEVKEAIDGNICFMAAPAEEFAELEFKKQLQSEGKIVYGGGKCELIRTGAFDDVDLALGHHIMTDIDYGLMNNTFNGFVNKAVTFHGHAVHAAGRTHEGIDALNAATSAMVNIALQQESFRDEDSVRVHGFISGGGTAANVIADNVTMQYCVRAKTPEACRDASKKVDRSLKAAAMATGCGVTIDTMAGYMSGAVNPDTRVLESVFADLFTGSKYTNRFDRLGHNAGSDDFGDVAMLMPLHHFYTGGYTGRLHNPNIRVSDEYLAYVVPAKIFALAAYRLMKDGATMAKENLAVYKPQMTKESYLAYLASMQTTEVVEMEPLPIVGQQ